MKRSLILLMALLLTTPALAAVSITCTDEGSGVVRIDYDRSGEPAKVRAFALDVSIDANCAVIASVTDYSGGEGNKYGIFPGNIDLSNLESPVWGSPVAPANDPGAEGTGTGTSRVILEMGSLYDMNTLPGPADTGMLCKLNLTGGSGTCHVSIVVETTRGGVVLETGATASITAPGCDVQFGPAMPACWVTSQCDGDAGDADYPAASMPENFVTLDDFFRLQDSFATNYWHYTMGTGTGQYNPCSDHNRDGYITLDDFFRLQDNFMQVPPNTHGCGPTAGAPVWDGRWPPVEDH